MLSCDFVLLFRFFSLLGDCSEHLSHDFITYDFQSAQILLNVETLYVEIQIPILCSAKLARNSVIWQDIFLDEVMHLQNLAPILIKHN